jgi:hypothetical protein
MKKLSLIIALIFVLAVPAAAQVSVPYTFSSGNTILASEVNANFSTLAASALNRTGGTITGTIAVDTNITIDGVDISDFLLSTGHVRANTNGTAGSPAFAPSTDTDTGLFFAAGAISASLDGTERLKLDANGLTVFGTNIINSSGKVPGFTSAYFTSLDGSAITNVAETSITDGAILARLAASETITGAWTFTATNTALSLTPTWNNGATTFRALDINVTNTASASASKLLDARVGGSSLFSVDASGKVSTTTFQMTSGATNGHVLTSDGSGNASWVALPGGTSGVPSGMVAMFETSCPAGWTSRSGAGQPYQSKFPRGGATYSEAGGGSDTHVHAIDPVSTASSTDGSHTHSFDPAAASTNTTGAHTHNPEVPSSSTSTDGAHTHSVSFGTVSSGGPSATTAVAAGGLGFTSTQDHTHNFTINGTTTSSDGSHSHTITWPATTSQGDHSHTFDLASTGSSSGGSHSHTTDIASFNSGSGSNVPAYIQVVFCRKN